jgi:hypothetical protein
MNLSSVPGVFAYKVQRYPEQPVQPVERTELSLPERSRRFEMPRLYGPDAQAPDSPGHLIDLFA